MSADSPKFRPPPGRDVPPQFRAAATFAIACCCLWLAMKPRFAENKHSVTIGATYTTVDSEHGWPLTAFHLVRATGWYDGYSIRRTIYPIWIERLDWPALAYDVGMVVALIILTRVYFLPWQAYPLARLSLAEIFVWTSSIAVCLAIAPAIVALNSWHGAGQDTVPVSELAAWFGIWLVGTGTVNGFLGYWGWWSARRRLHRAVAPRARTASEVER